MTVVEFTLSLFSLCPYLCCRIGGNKPASSLQNLPVRACDASSCSCQRELVCKLTTRQPTKTRTCEQISGVGIMHFIVFPTGQNARVVWSWRPPSQRFRRRFRCSQVIRFQEAHAGWRLQASRLVVGAGEWSDGIWDGFGLADRQCNRWPRKDNRNCSCRESVSDAGIISSQIIRGSLDAAPLCTCSGDCLSDATKSTQGTVESRLLRPPAARPASTIAWQVGKLPLAEWV